jgi:hypothetical protein
MPRSARARAAILLALALGAGTAPAQEARDGGPAASPDAGAVEGPDAGPTPHRAFSGRVSGVDWAAQRLTVDWAGRSVAMTFDRNTQVYLPERLGTLRDLEPGVEVRAAQGPTGLAIWVEVLRGAAALDGGAPPPPPPGSRP